MIPADLTRRRLLQSGAGAAAALLAAQVGIPGTAAAPRGRRRADFNEGVFANEARLFAGDYTPVGWNSVDSTGRALMGSGQVPDGPLRQVGDRGDGAALAMAGGERASLALGYMTPADIPNAYGLLTGEIRAFAFARQPAGWLPCDGRELQINAYVELFSILTTNFGGDGRATFRLPNLAGRTPLEAGDAGRLPDAPFGSDRSNLAPRTDSFAPRLYLEYCICPAGAYPLRPRSEANPKPPPPVVEKQFLGELRAFVGRLPGSDWLPCDGRRLPFRGQEDLYSVIGSQFGGDDKTYFQVPDLRGRVTAGADPDSRRSIGTASGATGATNAAIPYEVVNWGIASVGQYPLPA
jgi:microcystin-dependent protein